MTQVENCAQCKNFFVTYDPKAPRGCKAYGFKTDDIPCQVVYRSTGVHCKFYSLKKRKS